MHNACKVLIFALVLFPFKHAATQKLLIPELNSFQGGFIHYPITEPGADISTTRLFFDKKKFFWSGTYDANFDRKCNQIIKLCNKCGDFVIWAVRLGINTTSGTHDIYTINLNK